MDIGRLRDLSYIRDEGDHVAIGALTRHHDLATSELLAEQLPLLAHAAGTIGDPQVRHRGTIGGSLAHADPAGDLPAVVLALEATLVARGPSGSREIPATEFFPRLLRVRARAGRAAHRDPGAEAAARGWSFQKFTKRAIDWAIVGVAVQGDRIGLVNMGEKPVRATAVEQALASGASIRDAAEHAADGLSPASDVHASAEYRAQLARVLVRRGLEEARARA